jgi:hypothetical protein
MLKDIFMMMTIALFDSVKSGDLRQNQFQQGGFL